MKKKLKVIFWNQSTVIFYCLDFSSTNGRMHLSKLLLPIAAWEPPKPRGSVVGWGKCARGRNWETQPLQQRTTKVISLKILRTAASWSSPLSLQIPAPRYPRGASHSFSGLSVLGRSQTSQPQKSQGYPSSALPQLKHPAEEQKIFAQAQHDANTATLLLEHGQLTQGRLRGWVELMKSCLYTHPQDQLQPIHIQCKYWSAANLEMGIP